MGNDDIENIADRIGALSGDKPPAPKRKSPLGIIFVMTVAGAIAGAWGFAYFVNQNKKTVQTAKLPDTSTASEFQSGLSGLQATESPAPAPPLVVRQNNDAEMALLQSTIDKLEAQIKDMQANPKVETVQDETALQELRQQLTDIRANLEKTQSDYEQQQQALDEKDRDILRLQDELETERMLRGQDDEEAMRLAAEQERRKAELERRRAEAKALLDRKVNSPITAYSTNSGSGGEVEDAKRRYTGDEAFRRAGADAVQVTRSEIIANPANTIVQGTLIEGTLETGILSDLAGNVTAIISYDVWSFDMSQVLIPRGSKLYGRYSSNVGVGDRRVLIAWDRIITTDGQSVQISAYGSDRLGRSGLPGRVNNHFLERFGSAALVSFIGAVPKVAANSSNNETAQSVAKDVGDNFESAVQDVMGDFLSIPPTISVDHGAVVMIRVNTDLELF